MKRAAIRHRQVPCAHLEGNRSMKRVVIAIVAGLLAVSAANAAGPNRSGKISSGLPNGKHWTPFG